MLEAAAVATRDAAADLGVERPRVLGVTVLTSLDQTGLKDIGVERKVTDQVRALVGLARDAGLDGVVCAPTEVREVRRYVDDGFLVVTPGIRTPDDGLGDQRRVAGPKEALADGASYLVIGRPITAADDPAAALEAIRERMRR
jgi:orotidine-5'-phosphate decarboxylase